MNALVIQGFTKSLATTMLSDVGGRTFCVAAILATQYPRKSVLLGCLVSVTAKTVISAMVGWAALSLLSKNWSHHVTTFMFFLLGLRSLWEGFTKDDDDNEELEVEKGWLMMICRRNRSLSLTSHQSFSRMAASQAFSLTFFRNWRNKSQLATIGLAADENILAVVLGGIAGQVLCTVAAVTGGESLASKISERLVTLLGGFLFLAFGVQSLLSPS
ncbi:GDT1-like protein 5 isoform X1 [Eucalyptus grandis]|uniref:GDT1-like protein 5 isoform X1 n=1 Tax=Eucalyptus grandis TaxID=71139 RepID=UPI00192E83AB|nr:GDT1-like protein 5 isoform X1 [Eucalyptus grandis]